MITSIGPGALQDLAGSLATVSNGVGVYHIYGDETTHGEGYKRIDLLVPEEELKKRRAMLKPPPRHATRGYAKLYHDAVMSAPMGCDFDFLRPK